MPAKLLKFRDVFQVSFEILFDAAPIQCEQIGSFMIQVGFVQNELFHMLKVSKGKQHKYFFKFSKYHIGAGLGIKEYKSIGS